MPSIVVTGSNGFIGTNVLDALLKYPFETLFENQSQDAKITKSTKFVEPKNTQSENQENNTLDKLKDVDFIVSDLPESLARLTARRFAGSSRVTYVDHEELLTHLQSLSTPPLLVVHNGACSTTTETRSEIFLKLNLNYTKDLWTYCSQHRVPLIYASSAAVYGDGSKGFDDAHDKNHLYSALNFYGKSKLDFDKWALLQAEQPPLWFGLRYFNVFGPFEAHKGNQATMAYQAYNQILKTGKVKLFKSNSKEFADGEQKRDFVYVRDVVDVTVSLMEHSLRYLRQNRPSLEVTTLRSGIFNVGTGVASTWNELVNSVFDALKIKSHIEYIDIPESLAKQYQNFTQAKTDKLREILGPTLTFSKLDEAVQHYVTRFLSRGL